MREENYNPRIGAYFTALSGERNKFPPFGSCLGAYVYTALRQFRPKPQLAEALSPPLAASPQTNAIPTSFCSNSFCLLLAPIRCVSRSIHARQHLDDFILQ